MTALPIALAATLAAWAEPPGDVDAQGAALSRELDQMALVLGAGAVLSALDATWAWHDPGSYRELWGDREDVTPFERTTPLAVAPLAAGAGAFHLRAIGRARGLAVRMPDWYWLGLFPTITTVRAMAAGEAGVPPSPIARRTVVAGTAAAFAWYAASTAWLSWRLRTGPPPSWATPVRAPAAPTPGLALARRRREAAFVLGAVAAGTGALAAWAWGDPRSYVAFTLGEDPGPSLDPSPLLAPFVAPPAAAASGVLYLRALGAARGVEARIPAWYWLGLAPLATTYQAMAAPGNGASARRTVVAGTLGACAWFAGATTLLAWRLPQGPAAAAADADLSLEPLAVQAPRGSVTGLSLRGTF